MPAYQLEPRSSTLESAEQRLLAREHIFAVNTAASFLDVLRDVLQDERYNVTTTNFTTRTFEQVAAAAPDLLIVDLTVGQQGGWDFLERLRQDASTQGIPVLIVSTSAEILERAKLLPSSAAARQFLRKPFALDELVVTVQSLLSLSVMAAQTDGSG